MDTSSPRTGDSFVEKRRGDTWINAVIGVLVAYVLSVTVVGGVVASLAGGVTAGYLQGGSRAAGAKVGALSGALSVLPLLAVFGVMVLFAGVGFLEGGVRGLFGVGLASTFLLVVFLAALAYTVVLSAAGGYVGSMVRARTDDDDTRERGSPTSEGRAGIESDPDAAGTDLDPTS